MHSVLRRVRAKIGLQDAPRLGHIVRIADVDGDLGDVRDRRPSSRQRVGEVLHHHFRLGVEVVRREHLAIDIGRHLACGEHQLLRAFGGHDMRIAGERL